MNAQLIVGFFVMLLPILAGVMIYMSISTGKGNSNITDEILAHRHKKMLERDKLHAENFEHQKPK
jgi:hypothetical protein|tara:strand:+ start:1073 stop:1267 length:195 start_codon:yes stop_codon:yes gene_type:complete